MCILTCPAITIFESLISALSFHGITTQVSRAVYLAVSRGRYARLRLRMPPVKIYRFDAAAFDQGIETHRIDGVTVRIYGVARTLVDCFKYRNKLGLDIAIEAPRFARERKRTSNREILYFARLLRQVRVIGPYVESVTQFTYVKWGASVRRIGEAALADDFKRVAGDLVSF